MPMQPSILLISQLHLLDEWMDHNTLKSFRLTCKKLNDSTRSQFWRKLSVEIGSSNYKKYTDPIVIKAEDANLVHRLKLIININYERIGANAFKTATDSIIEFFKHASQLEDLTFRTVTAFPGLSEVIMTAVGRSLKIVRTPFMISKPSGDRSFSEIPLWPGLVETLLPGPNADLSGTDRNMTVGDRIKNAIPNLNSLWVIPPVDGLSSDALDGLPSVSHLDLNLNLSGLSFSSIVDILETSPKLVSLALSLTQFKLLKDEDGSSTDVVFENVESLAISSGAPSSNAAAVLDRLFTALPNLKHLHCDYIDDSTVAQLIVKKCANLESIETTRLTDFSLLAKLPQLKRVCITYYRFSERLSDTMPQWKRTLWSAFGSKTFEKTKVVQSFRELWLQENQHFKHLKCLRVQTSSKGDPIVVGFAKDGVLTGVKCLRWGNQ